MKNTPPETNFLKIDKNSLKKKKIIQAFFYIAM
jgi:hypothetical protein